MSIEIKIPDEKINAMADEAICKAKSVEYRELTPDELESATGGRILKTGEVITEQVIDSYAAIMRRQEASSDVLIIFSEEMGFYPLDREGMSVCNHDYEGAWIDYWVPKQKSKVRQEKGELSLLDQFSIG